MLGARSSQECIWFLALGTSLSADSTQSKSSDLSIECRCLTETGTVERSKQKKCQQNAFFNFYQTTQNNKYVHYLTFSAENRTVTSVLSSWISTYIEQRHGTAVSPRLPFYQATIDVKRRQKKEKERNLCSLDRPYEHSMSSVQFKMVTMHSKINNNKIYPVFQRFPQGCLWNSSS